MLHFKYHALARRQQFEGGRNPPADFESHQAAFRIGRRSLVLLAIEEINGRAVATQVGRVFGRLIFRPAAAAAEMIEADIGYDAAHPRIKTTLETEPRQIFVNFQKSFL